MVDRIHDRASLEQLRDYLRLAARHRPVEWRLAVLVLAVDLCAVVAQQVHLYDAR